MKLYTLTIAILLIVAATRLQAQNAPDSTKYLFENESSFSGFGGTMAQLSWVRNRPIFCFGGGGGFMVNQKFFLGGYGMGNVVDGPLFTYNGQPVSMELGHGGLWLGYNIKPQNVLHFGFSSRFGWGGVGLKNSDGVEVLSDGIFVLSPQVHAEVNLLPFMKLNVSGGYRSVLGVNNPFFNRTDFNSPFAMLGVYFGWFGD